MITDPISGYPWETDDRDETDRAHDIAQQDFYRFCVHELEQNTPYGLPAGRLLGALWTVYNLQAARDDREWDPLATRLFEAVEDLGWGGTVRIIGQAMETVS
jgi:hypothetical protein